MMALEAIWGASRVELVPLLVVEIVRRDCRRKNSMFFSLFSFYRLIVEASSRPAANTRHDPAPPRVRKSVSHPDSFFIKHLRSYKTSKGAFPIGRHGTTHHRRSIGREFAERHDDAFALRSTRAGRKSAARRPDVRAHAMTYTSPLKNW